MTTNTPTTTPRRQRGRDDDGFSLVQVLVAMIILGVLSVAVGLTTFNLIGQSRETVLAANIRTAAQAVETTLAFNRGALGATPNNNGVPSNDLISALGQTASFNWQSAWTFDATDDEDTVRVQLIRALGTPATLAAEPGDTTGVSATTPPTDAPGVSWLTQNGGAIRLQIRDSDGRWVCALVVMQPSSSGTFAVAQSRGVWYDTGRGVTDAQWHNCSPTDIANNPTADQWNFAAVTARNTAPIFPAAEARTLQRSVVFEE